MKFVIQSSVAHATCIPCFESIVGVGWPMAFSSVTSLFTKSIDLGHLPETSKGAGNLRDSSHRSTSSAPSDVESLFAPLESPHTSSYIVRIACGPWFVGSIFDIVDTKSSDPPPFCRLAQNGFVRPDGPFSGTRRPDRPSA